MGHGQELPDVLVHDLGAGPNRITTPQAEQVEGCCSQRGQHTSTIAAVAVSVFTELDIADPVPALNAPAIPHQFQ